MGSDTSVFDALSRYSKALLTALGYRDLMTRLHSDRVEGLSMAIGNCCGLDAHQLSQLRIGASFHDIGKIGVPDKVLLKPGRFDSDEWEMMKQHSAMGEKIMLSTELAGSDLAARSIRHHHEHYDGTGYPDGLAGEDIPICARIISIADSYDAMAVTRSYHQARKHGEIMEILRHETGHKHDPYLMDIFLGLIENSPLRASD